MATTAITWGDKLSGVAVDGARRAADCRDGEYAGGDGAPDAADAVDGEDLKGVVDLDLGAQVDGYVAEQSRSRAYGERAVYTDEPGGGSDGDEARDGSRRHADGAHASGLYLGDDAPCPGPRRPRRCW